MKRESKRESKRDSKQESERQSSPDPSSDFDPALLRQLFAEQAIQRVVGGYGRGIDERDFERVRRCFHSDATITYGSEPTRPLSEAIAWLERMTPAVVGLSHYFGPPIVDLSADGDTAHCQTWCLNVIEYPRGPDGDARKTASGLLYDDVFERRDGHWRITQRRNHTEWALEVEGDMRLPMGPPRTASRASSDSD